MATKSRYEGYVNAIQSLHKTQQVKQHTTQQKAKLKNFSTKESVLAKLKELKAKPGIVRVPVETGDNNA